MSLNRRAQVFAWDMIFSLIIFFMVLGSLMYLWTDTVDKITVTQMGYEMSWLSTAGSEQLVRTAGVPYNWSVTADPRNITIIGLADSEMVGNSTRIFDRILDPDKLIHLINLTQDDYPGVRNMFLCSGKYDFYVVISCLNASDTGCFEGQHIDAIENGSVTCQNGLTFVMRNNTLSVGRYVWIEAEDFDDPGGWAKISDAQASKTERMECDRSGSHASTNISLPSSNVYAVWVRYYDFVPGSSNGAFVLEADGINSTILGNGSSQTPNSYHWNKTGTVSETTANIKLHSLVPVMGQKALVDVIFITNDLSYTPYPTPPTCPTPTDYYGCVTVSEPTKCIIGDYIPIRNATYMVSDTKTATFSGGSETRGIEADIFSIEPTMRIVFVVYKPPQ